MNSFIFFLRHTIIQMYVPETLLLDVAATLPSVQSVDSTALSSPVSSSGHTGQHAPKGPTQDHDHLDVGGKATVPGASGSGSGHIETSTASPPVSVKRGSVIGGTNPTCPRCGKNVYFAEMIQGPGGSKYHKLCFRCTDCDKSLDSMNSCVTTENVLLCKTCYSKKHGPVGFGCVKMEFAT